jgi:hypothetical protein
MAKKTPARRKYRVLYAITRGEYYEIEAANPTEAKEMAFDEGILVLVGDTTNVVDCEVVEIEAFGLPILSG